MNRVWNWAKHGLMNFGITIGFVCLKQYSAMCMYIQNLLSNQYYQHKTTQTWMDFVFEWYHFLMAYLLCKYIEPPYNPWVTIFYMKSGVPQENYFNLNKNSDVMDYFPRKITAALPLTASTKIPMNETGIYEMLNSIYYTYNFIKTVYFDACFDYLIVLKYKNVYISRVGIYAGMKNLRKEDFSMEKAARSILMVEYLHPKMAAPILLNIDTGYFIENNEILSPMFVRRALMYQREPFVFDYQYKLKFMDSNIKSHTIDSRSFVLLKRTEYEIVNFDL